ncbi:MAG: M20/M25/M40 family metallo-hydrolase [Candidatus Thorarchaeota archaeon]|jgi:Iap family predicted aminopeptidase
MEVSIDKIRETIEELCHFENRIAGTETEQKAAGYLVGRLKQIGFDKTGKQEFPVLSWDPKEVMIRVTSPIERPIECAQFPYSPSVEESVRLIDMESTKGKSANEAPTYGLAEWGPILYGSPTVAYNNALDMGMDGLIISSHVEGDLLKILIVAHGEELQIPIFSISKEDGSTLRNMLDDSEVILDIKSVVDISSSNSCNIEAVIDGSDGTHDIVVSAHYDAWFSGAADNGAPVAIVLEAARILKEHVNQGGGLRRSVRFLFYGAEESGSEKFHFYLNGSRNYVQSQDSMEKLALVVNLDSIGYEAPNYVVVTHELSDFAKSMIKTLKQEDRFVHFSPPGYGSDHWFFTTSGVPTIYLISWPSHLYHTQMDTPEILDYVSIQAYAEFVVNSIVRFSNAEVLPMDVMYLLDMIRARISEIKKIKGDPFNHQQTLDVLDDILKHRRALEQHRKDAADSVDRTEVSKLNDFLVATAAKINRTIGLLRPMEGLHEANYLSHLELISDYLELDSAIKTLERLPFMKVTPRTRDRFRKHDDVPMEWVEVQKPVETLSAERERVASEINREMTRFTDALSEILTDIVSVLDSTPRRNGEFS